MNKKRGSDATTSEPLFISARLAALFLPHPLTLLLIGGQFYVLKTLTPKYKHHFAFGFSKLLIMYFVYAHADVGFGYSGCESIIC
jgi:hypothetical protein